MTNTRTYDGGSKLGDAIAVLYGCSPRSNNKISELTKQAKAALGIGKSKRLNADVNRSIWQWHYDRLQALETFQQIEFVNIVSQPEPDSLVELFSQAVQGGTVEILSQPDDSEGVETISQAISNESVEHYSQPETVAPVDIISHTGNSESVEIISQVNINDLLRIAFYTAHNGVRTRQVIAIEVFMVNALMLATGITKQDIPKWIQGAVDGWAAFDSELPITKQVKYLLIRELTTQLERLKNEQQISR